MLFETHLVSFVKFSNYMTWNMAIAGGEYFALEESILEKSRFF